MSQPWLNRCDIKYCKNNVISQNQVTPVHSTPRNLDLFQKWEKEVSRIGMKLPRTARICERHFNLGDIVEFGCLKKEKGSVTSESIKIRVLVKGAVPTRFEEEIAEYLKQKDLQDKGETVVHTEKIPSPQKRPRTKVNCVLNIDNSKVAQQQNTVVPISKSAQELLFEKIYTGQIEPRLPSKSWNIHNCQLPEKGFVFSEIAALSIDNTIPPLFKKSVFFDGNFNIRVYLIGKYFPNVEFNRPKTIRDVEELLGNVNAIKLCEGGPPLSDETFPFAYRDERMCKWRHISCDLRLKRGRICKNCSVLCRKAIPKNLDKKEKLKETKKRKKLNESEVTAEYEYLEE